MCTEKTKACNRCELRAQCTTNKNGRLIERTEYQQYVDRNNNRVYQDPEYYRQRQQIIEHQFGTLKRQWHFDYVLTKGKEKVLGEIYLAFTGYNLKRTLTILGFDVLMSKLAAHVSLFVQKYLPFLAEITSAELIVSRFFFHIRWLSDRKTTSLAHFSIS